MDSDDLYIPDPHNRAIDTKNFEHWVRDLIRTPPSALEQQQILGRIHDEVEERCFKRPTEPSDDAIVCRFLSPAKFVWFCHSKTIHFSQPSTFDDPSECQLHWDYDFAISRTLSLLGRRFALENPNEENPFYLFSLAWNDFKYRQRDRWHVSCWTILQREEPDYLILHRYAEGPLGVGVAIRYGTLKDYFNTRIHKRNLPPSDSFAGMVDYSRSGGLAPFIKRPMFETEKEVRLVYREKENVPFTLKGMSVAEIADKFRLKFSPDVPQHNRNAMRHVWKRCGFFLD